jgi:hypothetical protein
MKKWIVAGLFCVLAARAGAQSFEVQQLILDIQKLSQLKKILQDLKDGYQVLDKGYSAVRDISQGSFDLHKAFLDALMIASPGVRNYVRVAQIIGLQGSMLSKYQAAWEKFSHDPHFRPDELAMMATVYGNLLGESARALDDLGMLLTDGALRASDAERLNGIDGIYGGMVKRSGELDGLTHSSAMLSLQRAADAADYETVKKLYGINP